MNDGRVQRRARWLVRLYPRGWRQRFGEEFEQLLIDEMHGRPHAPARTADVAAHALLAHLSAAGLAGRELEPEVQAWRSLRVLGIVTVVFLAFAVGMWSWVSVGWSWASPTAPDTRVAVAVMSGALLGLCVTFALAAAVVMWSIGRAIRATRQLAPLSLAVAGVVGLWVGCEHVAAQWPGASPGFTHHSIVPAAVARVAWAATLWLSAYWTHPGVLLARPGGQFTWMIISPALLAAAVVSGWLAMRRAKPSRRSLRTLAALGTVGVGCAGVFVAGAASWILGSGTGPHAIFQPGGVDDVGLVLLGGALLMAAHSSRRSLAVARRPPRA